MKTSSPIRSIVGAAMSYALLFLLCAAPGNAQTLFDPDSSPSSQSIGDPQSAPRSARSWNYTLLPSSKLTDECPICGRPPLVVPARGSFLLRLIEENHLFSTYAIEDISIVAGDLWAKTYKVRGKGTYRVGGEVAVLQDMSLEVWINNGSEDDLCYLANKSPTVTRGWPLVENTLDQTNGTSVQQYRLELAAAPVRELWFSTAHGFTPGIQPPPAKYVRSGDLVSETGRVVKTNHDLVQRLGLVPSPDPIDPGLDAFDILDGGDIGFSTDQDGFSETLGPIAHGDVFSDRGLVLRNYADLITPFGPMLPFADPGLDALQVLGSGEVLFSVENDFFSQRLGVLVRRGDLLSSDGSVMKTGEQLLAKFTLPPIPTDFGLDAIYVWPSGEVWFSLEEGFEDGLLGRIQHGDLISDRGELVYRNLDLLRQFQPLEDLADFGLDGVYVVSDALAPSTSTAVCVEVRPDLDSGDVLLRWQTKNRVRQLQKATSVRGPWLPVGPITTAVEFLDSGALSSAPQALYRLNEW